MSTTTAAPAGTALPLRSLYFVRFAFALVWAGLVFATASALTTPVLVLLVLYPVFDVAAAVVDTRSAGPAKPVLGLYVNMATSLLAAAGLVVAAATGIPGVLRVWGAWAIVSGLIQLAVGVVRRALGGQWPMIVSGALSTVAGASFFVQAGAPEPSLGAVAGYATLGGIFFLLSALRLGRTAK
ncbi:uncharacterized membrane protein HdeD (DUF308 family) [Crossiella equi]|uniref:Uncharacterized membrane protein HdeD (DUF308 family) n=1 Tax=Crossiella equi TaxID=130796 RepID=A0ABS5A8F2_9PSEU|nr:hypothetical protein [Crossiella equi]MBP2471970.1 uncharacterized membrane protein HdeD (DUF308 family) [Crossiella equi]